MKELKEKMMELGYTRIEDKTDNSFTAAAEDVVVYVEKVEVKELDPVLVNAFMFKAMEINPCPFYAWITNGEHSAFLLLEEEKSIPEIPGAATAEERKLFRKRQPSKIEKWSYEMYQILQKRFDDIHEQIYATKDHVDSTNDAIDEFCKLIFMEVFSLRHPNYKLKNGILSDYRLDDVFDYKAIEETKDKDAAVHLIREAFKEIKDHEDYKATLDDGTSSCPFGKCA
jgi:type I restriction enzyme M protein